MTSLSMGARVARKRLVTSTSLLAMGGGVALGAVCAAIERASSALHAADRTLAGAACGLLLPIGAYLLVERFCSGRRLDEALGAVTRRGANGRACALGTLVVIATVAAAFASAVALVSVLFARGAADPTWVLDTAQTVPIAILGALAYMSLFAMGSQFGRRGQGRTVLLALDWLLGSGTSMLALPWPRGHLRNLLGSQPVLGIGQSLASAFLLVLTLVSLSVALGRVKP